MTMNHKNYDSYRRFHKIDLENSLEKVIISDVKLIVKNLGDPSENLVTISRCDTGYCSKFLNFHEGAWLENENIFKIVVTNYL